MPDRPPRPCPRCRRGLIRNGSCDVCKTTAGRSWDHGGKSRHERGYGFAWTKLRDAFIADNPVCVDPFGLHSGQVCAAHSVDHVIPKAQGGSDDWNNLQSLCNECHRYKTAREGSHAAIVTKATIVCGPPASGKTTYVEERRGQRDVTIDLDAIAAALSATDDRKTNWDYMELSRIARDAMLTRLRQPHSFHNVWIVGVFADLNERTRLAALMNAAVVVMDTSAEACKQRITGDLTRRSFGVEQIAAVDNWFDHNGGRG